jgi:hypothetical protein
LNSLAATHPRIAKQWHKTLNDDLTAEKVTAHSGKVVVWQCPEATDHVWESAISKMVKSDKGCMFCSGKEVSRTNCLATIDPDLASEWDHKKNAGSGLTPESVNRFFIHKVWWRCKKAGHSFMAPIYLRYDERTGCPYCKS